MNLFWRVATPFIAAYFIAYHYRMVNAVLGPTLAAEFGLSAGGLGLLTSIYFLTFGVFQLPLGVLLDRYGPRRVNGTLLLVAAAGGAWFAAAESAGSAIAARALIGLGASCALMGSLTAFVLWYPPHRLATLNAIAFSAGAVGGITATAPFEVLLRVWPWRQVFLLLVAATVAMSLVLWLVVPERPKRDGTLGDREHGPTIDEQLRELGGLLRDTAFLRLAVCLGTTQFAAISLQSLWIAPWLRDVASYTGAEVARALIPVNLAMVAGYLGFAAAAEALSRRGRSLLPLLASGVAVSCASLAMLVVGWRVLTLGLWCIFIGASTAVILAYSILSRRLPPDMAGRANTAVNTFAFVGMFVGQWAFGIVLDQWPQTPGGYAPDAYPWALGMLLAVQLAGLAWLWNGRKQFNARS